jgi:hypothetical protein
MVAQLNTFFEEENVQFAASRDVETSSVSITELESNE